MNKKIWDLYAPFYKTAMKADSKIYEKMYVRISKVIRNKKFWRLPPVLDSLRRTLRVLQKE